MSRFGSAPGEAPSQPGAGTRLKMAGDSAAFYFYFLSQDIFFSGSTSQSLLSFFLLSAGFSTVFCHH